MIIAWVITRAAEVVVAGKMKSPVAGEYAIPGGRRRGPFWALRWGPLPGLQKKIYDSAIQKHPNEN